MDGSLSNRPKLDVESFASLYQDEAKALAAEHDVDNLVKLADQWGAFKIETAEHAGHAADLIVLIKKAKKEIDEARKTAKEPVNDLARKIQDTFTTYLDLLVSAAAKVEKPLGTYQAEQKRRADEEAKKKREEAEKKAAEAKALAEAATSVEEARAAKALAVEARTERAEASRIDGRTRTVSGTMATTRSHLIIRVDDISKVPTDYLVVDESKVRDAINAAKKSGSEIEIPGIHYEYESRASVRG